MNPLAHVLTSVGYPHRVRAVPPAEPPDLAETVQIVTSRGRWQPEPGVRYLRAWELPMPRHPDPVVFGPDPKGERC